MSAIDKKTFESLQQTSGVEFVRDLIDTFLEEGAQLVSGLRIALAAGDAESFRRAAHSLKSNAATFGAQELAGLARQLEDLGRSGELKVGDRLAQLEQAFQTAAEELKGLRA